MKPKKNEGKEMKELIAYLTGRVGGTDLPTVDKRVESLPSLSQSKIDWAWDQIQGWQPVFPECHLSRVEDLLTELEREEA
jgi:hypothetical protein